MSNILENVRGERGAGLQELREESPLALPPQPHTWFGPPDPAVELEKQVEASRLPPLANVIRKTSIVGCLAILLGGLLWCMLQTFRFIHQWRPPSGVDAGHLCWPVAKAYLLLGAQISLFFIVTLFALMIPSLVMTWITAVVLKYLFGVRWGKKRHDRLFRSASDLAKEMSWSTLKTAVREGNLIGVAAVVALCLLPWVLGTSNLFSGNSSCG